MLSQLKKYQNALSQRDILYRIRAITKWLARGRGSTMNEVVLASSVVSCEDMGPLYHDYSLFGMRNHQIPGIFQRNQQAKEPILRSYIAYSIAKSLNMSSQCKPPSFMEMFCADGYYAMMARKFGAAPVVAMDNDKDGHLAGGERVATRLRLDRMSFVRSDVYDLEARGQFDIIANVGGLYHVSKPQQILQQSFMQARRFLIIQSVVNIANNDADYFEAPAPGWTWGSRMSRNSFHKIVTDLGGRIVDQHFNELLGNDRLEDRGSVYYLVEKS